LEAAEKYNDSNLLVIRHFAVNPTYFRLGNLNKCREHVEQVLSFYSEERHGDLANILNHDPKTMSLAFAASATWALGYPDQAIKISDAKDAHGRRCAHPFDLGWALSVGAQVYNHMREPQAAIRSSGEAHQLGAENSLPVLCAMFCPITSGIALIEDYKAAEGVNLIEPALEFWHGAGGKCGTPYFQSVLAKGKGQLGNLDDALLLIEEVIEQAERPGWEERFYYAESLRIKGWLLLLKGDLEGASAPTSPPSTGRDANKPNPGNCAPR
jgi:hypothetical protein